MTWLISFLSLVLAVVSRANGTGSKLLLPVRLAIEGDDLHKRPEDRSSVPNRSAVPKISDNRSIALKRAKARGHPKATASGSLTCMRWTGGTCKFLGCRGARGPGVVCEDGYCMCKSGSCADSEGKCIPNFNGKWINGEYSIRFDKPFLLEKPFLGVAKGGSATGWTGLSGVIGWLAVVSTSEKQWKILQTPNGRVRLANTKHPGSVLAIYNNRRRSNNFMQRQAQQQQKKINDDNDLWPVLMKLEATTPLEATFQVRPTMKNGGGIELWDPANQVSLASADPDSWGDSVVEQGVTECYQKSVWTSDPCDGGRQLIVFEPQLPANALLKVTRSHIVAISIWTWWQIGFFICCICACGICLSKDEHNPNSQPLISHVVNSAQEAFNRRAEAAREAEAERARERDTFAEKVAGTWVLEFDAGTFEYELWTGHAPASEGIRVHGRSQGSSQWDSTFAGHVILASTSTDADTLCWEDDGGTKFSFAVEDDNCSGMAKAVDGQQVSFTGKRVHTPVNID